MRVAQVIWAAAVLLLVGQLYTPELLTAAPSRSDLTSDLTSEMALLRGGQCYIAPTYSNCTCTGLPTGQCSSGGCVRMGPGFDEEDYTCTGAASANGRTSTFQFSATCPVDPTNGKKSCGKTGFNCCLWDVCGGCEFSGGKAICKATSTGTNTPKDKYSPSGEDCSS